MHDDNKQELKDLPVDLVKSEYGGIDRGKIEATVSAIKELSGPITLFLYLRNVTNAFESVKLTTIQTALSQPGAMSKLSRTLKGVPSMTELYKSIGLMKGKGVVKLGAKVGNSNKYYLTDLGVLIAEYLYDCIEEATNRDIMKRRALGLPDQDEEEE